VDERWSVEDCAHTTIGWSVNNANGIAKASNLFILFRFRK
jgi:hypothetical protein